jgi:hypothetical protein
MTDPILAAERLRAFAREYQQMRGNDPEVIYALHTGTDAPAVLTVDDLLAVADEVTRLRRTVADLRAALSGMVTNALKIAGEA